MITVNENLCKGCNLCTEFCPQKVFKESEKQGKNGVHVPVPVDEEKCKKCGLCALMCPDQAIRIDEEDNDE